MAKKGEVKYTDLFAADVHYGLLELQDDFKKLDVIAQGFSKTITGTKARIKVVISEETKVLKENKAAFQAVDVAARGAEETIIKLGNSTQEASQKAKVLREQQEGLNKIFDLSKASVDDIKKRVSELTKEYNSLGRETDQDKAKLRALANEVSHLKKEQDQLTGSLKKATQAVNVAEGSYTQASRKLAELRKTLREMPNAINKTTGEWNRSNIVVRQQLVEIEKLDRGIKRMDATMGQHQRNVGNYRGAISGAVSSIAGWAAAYLSASEAVRFVFDKSLEFDAIRTSLAVSFGSMEAADSKMRMLQSTAERLGVEYVTLAKSYKQFMGAAIASEFPLQKAEKVFQSVANASAKMKLSSEQTEGALRALEQMISKGNVQAEELRGQLGERLPGAFAIAARAMGVTTQQLNKMLENGEVLASDLLPKLADELDKTFGNDKSKKIEGLTAAWGRFKNAFQIGVDQNSNISKFFELVIVSVTDVANRIVKTVNSSSWKEFFFRMGALNVMNPGMAAAQGAMADATRAGSDYKKNGDAQNLLNRFVGRSRQDQIGVLESQEQITQNARNRALSSKKSSDVEFYKEQVKVLKMLSEAYKDAWKSKQQLVGKTKEEGSAAKSSPSGSSPGTLDGFEALTKQLRDLEQQVEVALLDGIVNETDRRLAEQYKKIKIQLESLLKLKEELLNPKSAGPLSVQSAGVTSSTGGLNTTPLVPFPAKEDVEDKSQEYVDAVRGAVEELRNSNYLISEAFGYEMGNMFDALADNLENFLTGSGNGFEDWAKTAAAAVQAIDEQIYAASERRIEQFEKEKDYKIKLAGNNAAAILAIEEESNKKIAEERRKQARSAKLAAMFEIAINTAIAATKVVGQTGLFGLPLVPLVIGLGAVQLALVAAQPIPQFFKGTDDAPRGFAEVAERGREMIIDKKTGRARLISDHSIYHMKGGEQVLTNPETEIMLERMRYDKSSNTHQSMANSVNAARLEERRETLRQNRLDENKIGEVVAKEMGKIMSEIPLNNWNVDENGFTKSIRKGNTTVTLVNKKNSL